MKKLIAYPKTKEQLAALKTIMKALKIEFHAETMDDTDRILANPSMVKRLKESIEQVKAGKVTKIEPADIWKI